MSRLLWGVARWLLWGLLLRKFVAQETNITQLFTKLSVHNIKHQYRAIYFSYKNKKLHAGPLSDLKCSILQTSAIYLFQRAVYKPRNFKILQLNLNIIFNRYFKLPGIQCVKLWLNIKSISQNAPKIVQHDQKDRQAHVQNWFDCM